MSTWEKIATFVILILCVAAVVFLGYIFTKKAEVSSGREEQPKETQKPSPPLSNTTPSPPPVAPTYLNEESAPGSIKGVIVDEQDTPVGDAIIECYYLQQGEPKPLNRRCISNVDGTFELSRIPPAEELYSLEITKVGFSTETIAGITVREGETTDVGKIKIKKGRHIEICVKDTEGRFIKGAVVTISKEVPKLGARRGPIGARFYTPIAEILTGEDGRVQSPELADGIYTIKVEGQGYSSFMRYLYISGGEPDPPFDKNIIVILKRK